MALTRPFPVDQAFPTGLDLRREFAALVPFEGIFPDPTTIAAAGIAYANGGWNVGARPFMAALRRGTAPYAMTYGTAFMGNDATGTAWTIPAAPISGSRIDLLWVRATDPSEGEGETDNAGPGGVARAVPVFGVTEGVPATTPATPALPAGALQIARVTTPSGAASITGSTFTHTYGFTGIIGGLTFVRSNAERDALSSTLAGQLVYTITTGVLFKRNVANTGWETVHDPARNIAPTTPTLVNGFLAFGTNQYEVVDGVVNITMAINKPSNGAWTANTLVATLPVGARPRRRQYVPARYETWIEPDGRIILADAAPASSGYEAFSWSYTAA